MHQRLVQKALHREAIKHTVELEVLLLRITQVQQTGNHFRLPACQLHPIRAGVVLHFRARFIRHAITTSLRRLADPQLAQQASQCRIADLDSLLLEKLLVDALAPVFAVLIQTFQQLAVDFDLVFPRDNRHDSLLLDNPPNRIATDIQPSTDFPHCHTFGVQQIHRITFVRIDHGMLSSFLGTYRDCSRDLR